MEADAVVADAEPELGRVDVLEALYVAFAGDEEDGPERGGCGGRWAGRWRGVGPWPGLSRRSFYAIVTGPRRGVRQRGSSHAVEVFLGESELGQNLFVGDGSGRSWRRPATARLSSSLVGSSS